MRNHRCRWEVVRIMVVDGVQQRIVELNGGRKFEPVPIVSWHPSCMTRAYRPPHSHILTDSLRSTSNSATVFGTLADVDAGLLRPDLVAIAPVKWISADRAVCTPTERTTHLGPGLSANGRAWPPVPLRRQLQVSLHQSRHSLPREAYIAAGIDLQQLCRVDMPDLDKRS